MVENISKAEFLDLSCSEQEDWIVENISDYQERLYGDGYLGCSYPVEKIDFEEYRLYAEDNNTADLISSKCGILKAHRVSQINAGAHLSKRERKCLADAIAEQDSDGWIGHHGFEIQFVDGSVFAYFTDESLGQGGFLFTYVDAFETKQEMLEYFSDDYALASEVEPERDTSLRKFLIFIGIFILAFVLGLLSRILPPT